MYGQAMPQSSMFSTSGAGFSPGLAKGHASGRVTQQESFVFVCAVLESVAGVFEKLDDRSREGGGRGGDAITTQRRFS